MSEYRTSSLAKKLPSTVPFVGPEAQERAQERAFRVRIGANESVFGPSPQVKKAINAAAVNAWKYGDPEFFDLRHAIAEHHKVTPEHSMEGEGTGAYTHLTLPATP